MSLFSTSCAEGKHGVDLVRQVSMVKRPPKSVAVCIEMAGRVAESTCEESNLLPNSTLVLGTLVPGVSQFIAYRASLLGRAEG